MEFKAAAERLLEIDETMKSLKAERDVLKERLDSYCSTRYTKPGEYVVEGVVCKRSKGNDNIVSDDPLSTAQWAISLGLDVFTERFLSSTKLKKQGALFSDDRVIFEGEAIPGARVSRTPSFTFSRQGTKTATPPVRRGRV